MISFELSEEQELIRDTVREFARSELRERARESDEASAVPEALLATSRELGLVAGAIPEEYGGGGLPRSPVTNVLVLEELGFGCASLAAAIVAPGLFVQPLLDFGTPAQQQTWLPRFCGDHPCPGTLALHEPRWRFDPTALETTVEPKGDGFVLTGRKRLVPLGDRAERFLVVARRRGAEEGLRGLEAFVVERETPGLSVSADAEKTLGFQSLPCARLELESVEVGASARLGGEDGIDGARLIASLRVGGAALAVGLARAVTELSIPYAKERVAFGEPIAKKQAIAFMLADMHSEVEAMRWLVWKAASQLENGLDATRAATLARDYVRRKGMRIADDGVQVFGGHGYIRDYPVEMWFRNMRALTVLEGPAAV